MLQMTELLLAFPCLQPSEGQLFCEGRSGEAGPGSPATVFTQEPPCQIHTAPLFILVLPRKEYVACWLHYFLHHFPEGGAETGLYLPTIPSFSVHFAMWPPAKCSPQSSSCPFRDVNVCCVRETGYSKVSVFKSFS